MALVLQRDRERAFEQDPRFVQVTLDRGGCALRVEGMRENVGEVEPLGDLERLLDVGLRPVTLAAQHEKPAELTGDRRDVCVRLAFGERLER